MKNITAILVDDEISNLKGLENKLTKMFPEIQILDAFQSPEEAILGIEEHRPDLLFLDIEMPRMNAFELLSRLDEICFKIIFVTAYSTYAIEAFKQNALDYILKPIDNTDLIQAVGKAKALIEQEQLNEHNQKLINVLTENAHIQNKVIVPTVKGMRFFKADDVIRLEGVDGYTQVYLTSGKKMMSSYSVGKYAQQLNSKLFFQCHRSHIININHVTEFLNEGSVILIENHQVPVSKSRRDDLLDLSI